MMVVRRVLFCLLTWLLLAVPADAGQSPPWEAGFGYFYHQSFDISRHRLRGAGLMGHWDRLASQGSWWRLDLRLELLAGGMDDYGSGQEIALVPGLRLYFNPLGHWRPYLEGGVGPSYNDLDIQELGTGFNFLSYGGFGLRLPLAAGTGLELGYRVRHLSNAGLDERNHGMTSHQLQAGLSWEF